MAEGMLPNFEQLAFDKRNWFLNLFFGFTNINKINK